MGELATMRAGRAEQTTARVSTGLGRKRGVHQPKRPARELLHKILRVVRVFLKPLGLLLHALFYFQNSSRFRLVLQGKRPLVVKCQSTKRKHRPPRFYSRFLPVLQSLLGYSLPFHFHYLLGAFQDLHLQVNFSYHPFHHHLAPDPSN